MPPPVAACVFFGFILWLFYCNKKEHAQVSAGSWVATLWVGLMASKPIAAWIYGRAGNEAAIDVNAAEGSSIDRNALVLMLVAAFIILKRRQFNWGKFLRENRWLVLFHLFTLVSTLWSDYTFVSLKRWIRDAGNVVMILTILTEADPLQAVRMLFMRCAYVLVPLSLLTMKYYLDIGVYYDPWTYVGLFCGVSTDKNGLGRLAWVSGLFLIWSLDNPKYTSWFKKVKSRWWELLVIGMCLRILMQANSATSFVCLSAASGIYFACRLPMVRSRPKLMVAGACLFILMSFLFLGVPEFRKAFTEMLGRKPDLTERTDVWANTMALHTNPLVGTGFASFWLTRAAQEMGTRLQVGEAHNGYLETYLSTGLIGLALLFAVLLSAGRNVLRHIAAGSPVGPIYGACLLAGILYNYTESAFNDSSLVGFMIWMVAVWYPIVPAGAAVREQDPLYAARAVTERPSHVWLN